MTGRGTDYIPDDMIYHEGATYVALRNLHADSHNDLAGTDVSPASPNGNYNLKV